MLIRWVFEGRVHLLLIVFISRIPPAGLPVMPRHFLSLGPCQRFQAKQGATSKQAQLDKGTHTLTLGFQLTQFPGGRR